MELLAYIQEEFIPTDDAIANDSNSSTNLESAFQGWLKKLTTKSAKLSLNVILASTTVLIGLGSTLSALAQVAPEQSATVALAPSPDVKYVQSLLSKNGFDPGAIDGVAGASTKNAIIRAQQALGLTPDGVAGSRTIAALENALDKPTTQPIAKADPTNTASQAEANLPSSSTVMNLQKLLADRGFYNGAVDGVMGNQTRAAIVSAQRTYNLTADGIAGSQTLAALESDGNKGVVTSTSSSTNTRTSTSTSTSNSTSTSTVKSAEVASLQELLKKRGFYNGAADGLMGPQTRLAIVEAQKNYRLATDGIAGSQTIAALESGSSKVNVTDSSTAKTTDTKNADTKNEDVSTKSDTTDKSLIALQDLLAKRGFYNGAIDGIKGARTSAAIVAAQKAYGLTPDGIAGSQTLAALEKDAAKVAIAKSTTDQTTKPASSVNDDGIANLQNLLADRGFYTGPITGVLGTKTKEAIITAQKAYGLSADGVAGPRTIAALESGSPRQQIARNIPAPAVTPTIRVIPAPQAAQTPQPDPQPQIRVQPQAVVTPQPTISAQPTPQVQVKPQVQQPQVQQPQVQAPTAAITPKPAATSVAVATPQAQANPQATVSDDQVLELQNLLAKRGFYNGKIDGAFTGETRNAIIRAQNFYTISPADGSPSNKLADSLSKDTFISEGN
jgi:peptidoglycan hydrolase-like protein with peptidoglycan-binding domain